MLQNIANLEGVSVLSKEQQKTVNGGYTDCVLNGQHQFNYSFDTASNGYIAVSESCGWTCKKTFIGIKTGGTIDIMGGC